MNTRGRSRPTSPTISNSPARGDPMSSDDDIALLHQVSRGLPRAVNNLAIQALVGAYATAKSVVDDSSALAAGSRHALPGVRPEDALLLNHEALSLGTLLNVTAL